MSMAVSSYARGENRDESDLDFDVVLRNSNTRPAGRHMGYQFIQQANLTSMKQYPLDVISSNLSHSSVVIS
jgi:predicted nucleotidyltransferase